MQLNMDSSIAKQILIYKVESSKTIENSVARLFKNCKKKIIGQIRKIFRWKLQKHFQISQRTSRI